MLRSILSLILLAFPLAAQASDVVLNDLKAQNGVMLSSDELSQLLPNARVVSYFSGSTRIWKNEPDGTFVAYSDVRGGMRKLMTHTSAQGTWHVGKNGTYCVTLDWPKKTEKWCRHIFKANGKYYGVKSLDDGAAIAYEFEFSK